MNFPNFPKMAGKNLDPFGSEGWFSWWGVREEAAGLVCGGGRLTVWDCWFMAEAGGLGGGLG